MGFGMGLLVDLALVQTLGVNSLMLVARRLRRRAACASCATRSHALTPLAVGAAAAAIAVVGFSLDPVPARRRRAGDLRLLREILATISSNALIALPVYALVRRVLLPALPDDPRRRRRRAYTTGGLSPLLARMIDPAARGPPPAVTPQLALRVAILGGIALALFAIIFFRLWFLQVLSGDQYLAQANDNRVRDVRVAGAARRIVDRNGNVLVDNRVASVGPARARQAARRDAARRIRLFHHLDRRVLHEKTKPVRCRVGNEVKRRTPIACDVDQQQYQLPYSDVTLKTDAERDQRSLPARARRSVPRA